MTAAPKIATSEKFAISFVGSKFDNDPKLSVATWGEFVDLFRAPRKTACTITTCAQGEHVGYRDGEPQPGVCKHKDGRSWLPATFSGKRTNEECKQLCMFVIDFDHVADDDTLEALLAKFERYQYLAHPSHSDKPGNRSVRVAIPLSQPVRGAAWPIFWPTAMAFFGLPVPADPACKNSSRLYYLPSRPSDADYWLVDHPGVPLDVFELEQLVPKQAPSVAAGLEKDSDGKYGPGQRHWYLISVAGALRNRGDGEDAILRHLQISNENCAPPKPESELRDIAKWAAKQTIGEAWRTDGAPADPDGDAWPEPEPVGDCLPSVPIFEPELLPYDLRAWVTDIANRMQVPIDLPAIYAMCALSVVATGARTVQPKRFDPWRVYPILWGIGIAPPSSMKTPSMKAAIKPLEMLEARSREAHKAAKGSRSVAAMVAKAKHDAIKKQVEAAVKNGEDVDAEALAAELGEDEGALQRARRFITQDSTTEKIQDLVERGGKCRSYPLGIVRDELLGLLHTFEREGRESDRTFYLEGWSVANKAVDRIGRGEVFTRDLSLIVFGSTTPGPFQTYVREACKAGGGADGLLQRFQMMVYPDPPTDWKHVDCAADRMAERRATELFERLAGIFDDDDEGKPPALRFCEEAQAIFDAWLGKLERRLRAGDEHQALVSHFGKYRSLMPAIALVCHLASGPGHENLPITASAAQTAITWCEYLEHHARRIYAIAADPCRAVAKLIEARILDGRLSGTVKQRTIQRQLVDHEPAVVHDALGLLEDLGWLRLDMERPGSKGGRPSRVVIVNPRGRRP